MTRPNSPMTNSPDSSPERWYPTSLGFDTDAPGLSRLALIETVLATGLLAWFIYDTHLFVFLFVSSVAVPFALFRTTESDVRTTRFALRLIGAVPEPVRWTGMDGTLIGRGLYSFIDPCVKGLAKFVFYLRVLLVMPAARFASLCVSLYLHFWECIAVLPKNWKKACLSIDMFRRAEILPGLGGHPEIWLPVTRRLSWFYRIAMTLTVVGFVVYILSLPRNNDQLNFVQLALLVYLTLRIYIAVAPWVPRLLTYFFAFWFRWSLKSTSVLWLPLLYIAADVDSPNWSAERRLVRIRESRFSAAMRWFGLASSTFIVGYVAVRIGKAKVYRFVSENVPFVDYFFGGPAAVAVASWNVVSVVNTVLAWGLYWLVDVELDRRKYGQGLSDNTALKCLKCVALLRWALFLFSWLCTVVVFYRIVQGMRPIPLRIEWLPWLNDETSAGGGV